MASKAISQRTTTVTLALALAGLLAGLGACKDKTGEEPGGDSPKQAEVTNEDGATEPEPPDPSAATPPAVTTSEADDPRTAALAITKSVKASAINGRGAKSLGFRIGKLTHLFALAATVKRPEWGAEGESEATFARDDNLDTAWQCKFGAAKPCVLGLVLPEKAKLEVVRLFTAAGPRWRHYTGHPRVAKVRVHTELGYVDAELADGANHAYVRFDAPIETQFIAIEVLEVHAGKTDALVHIAELELYGTDGVPRPAIELDPDLAWASWETTSWSDGSDHVIRQVFINIAESGQAAIDPEQGPRRRRIARATALFGNAGDDYLLFERLHGTDCGDHRGSYVLFDKRNRMVYPLGDLGGAGADVYRHSGGRGFVVGWVRDGQFTAKGVVEEGGELKWKRPPKVAPEDGEALLREWGFETEPLPRGIPIDGAIPGCHRAALGELNPLISAAKFKDAAAQDPSDWIVCSVGQDTVYASAPCHAPARAYQLSGTKLVGKHKGKKNDGRGLRLRRVGDRLLIELSAENGDTGTVLWSEPGSLVEIARDGALFVRPPSSCGTCEDSWPNPAGPDPSETVDEGEGDGNDESLDNGEPNQDGNDEPAAQPAPRPSPSPPG